MVDGLPAERVATGGRSTTVTLRRDVDSQHEICFAPTQYGTDGQLAQIIELGGNRGRRHSEAQRPIMNQPSPFTRVVAGLAMTFAVSGGLGLAGLALGAGP